MNGRSAVQVLRKGGPLRRAAFCQAEVAALDAARLVAKVPAGEFT